MRYLILILFTLSALAQTRSVVNTGTNPNDGTGDTLRTFGTKVNTNFFQLWQTVFTNGVPVLGEQITNIVVTPRMSGAVGDGETDDTVAIQSLFDNAPAGATIHFAPGTYMTTNGFIIRRHNLKVTGSGAIIKAASDLRYGTLFGVVNATNVIVSGLVLDADGQADNGITVIGNNSEDDGFMSALVGENYCSGVALHGLRVYRTRFDINLVQGLQFASPPSFTDGELLRLGSNEKYLTATVLTNDIGTNITVVRYVVDQFPLGGSVEGITSGYVATITNKVSIPQVSPNGVSYSSLNGAFGGKGISIQYGVRGVTVSDCQTFDCDVGLSVEGRSSGDGENSGTVITGCLFKNSGRSGIWFTAADAPASSAEVFGPVITGCRIQNWGHAFGGFGAISSDRAQYVRMTGILATQDPDYVPLTPAVLWVGTVANSHIEITGQLQESGGLLDFRRHPAWGALPGFLVDGSENNHFTVKATVASIPAAIQWTNSEDSYDIQFYAVNWEQNPNSSLGKSVVLLTVKGWTNANWLAKANSTVRYEITDLTTNTTRASGDASNAVEFDGTYRVTINGTGTSPSRVAVRFNDFIDINSLAKFASNRMELGWDWVNSYPYIRSRSGTFRVQNTAGEEIAQFASSGITTPSSAFNGKTLLMGARKMWFSGTTLYTKTTTPASATDGSYVVPARVGTVTLVGGTATVADAATSGTDIILLTSQVDGGTPGWVRVSGRVNATSFTITSSSGTDTSTIGYFIWKP
jgi:hypothetical protein